MIIYFQLSKILSLDNLYFIASEKKNLINMLAELVQGTYVR